MSKTGATEGLGIAEDGDDEGGMVTGGGGGTYAFGTRHHVKATKRNRRRERHQTEQQKIGEPEEEDSSDLSDESDDDGEFTQRLVADIGPGLRIVATDSVQGCPAD
jgi:target of rapamycin complex 2 subunit MAPKAP1/AVO1